MKNNMRLAKGWTLFGTNALGFGVLETRQDVRRREHKFNNAIRNLSTMTEIEMKKHSDKLFEEVQADENQLLQAFKDKKLKSKSLIKKAKKTKARKEKDKKKAATEKGCEAVTAALA